MPLPPYYLEVILVSGMACLVAVVMNSRGGPSGALCIFHQRSWRFPLCTHHHSLGPHIGTNRGHHFGWPLGLCPWGRPEGFWWFCHLWSEFGCHTYHRSFWYFHKDFVCRVWQCAPCFAHYRMGIIVAPIIDLPGRPVESFLHLVQSPLRIFAFGESLPEVLLFFFGATQDCCTQWRPCGRGFGWHWTWLRGDGGCPTVNTGQYVWVSCIQIWTENHQPLV